MGVCSRREADRLIEAGRVCICGRKAAVGDMLEGGEEVTLDGKLIGKAEDAAKVKRVVLAVNKPVGVVCSASDNDRAPNIVDMVEYPERVYPVGRLDKDSCGLILMTNDGELANEITKTSAKHEKEYEVVVNKAINDAFIKKMSGGMYLKDLNKSTLPCSVTKTEDNEFNIVLTQGLNRQIRRMCEECGYRVLALKRIRIMNIRLGRLREGTFRKVDPELLKDI